ncbi:stalk domain-containing protein [Anaeropeptidivorans aminofermentans]|jgi:hypothetical protein|uniref:stalk domain-containing protein n=1 Tax=Anaeropeptidivorans aminofermentans TaxID=2934315 RepID=UPI0020253609|nr:stalk domain-containing protein [Anaeropeptidivorans aminofermentans]
MKKSLSKSLVLIFLSLSTVFSASTVYGGEFDVKRFEMLNTNKLIKGENVEYTFMIPYSWQKYVSLKREMPGKKSDFTEKIIVYYQAVDAPVKQTVLMTLCVYDKDKWSNQSGFRKISESGSHVMAISTSTSIPFSFGSDKIRYEDMLKEANNDYFLKTYINFEGGNTASNVVYVNGKMMKNAAYPTVNNMVYIPVREVCEALGYKVSWSERDQMVTVSSPNGDFYSHLLYDTQINKKYPVINRSGLSYVSSSYFLQVIKCNIEIDDKFNVKIVK